jgi:hypothetical protein
MTNGSGVAQMVSSEGRVATMRAERYLDQLSEHLAHLGGAASHGHSQHAPPIVVAPLRRSGGGASIGFELGTLEISTAPGELVLRISSSDLERLGRLKHLVANRVTTIGRRDDLTMIWRAVEEVTDTER